MVCTARQRYLTVFGMAFFIYSSTIFWEAQAQTPTANSLPERTTILTGSAARPLFKQHSRRSPDAIAYWTPTPADVRPAEKALKTAAPTFKIPYASNVVLFFEPKRLHTDYRQYAGFVDKTTKHKCLYVNGFVPSPFWEEADSSSPGKKRFNWKRDAEVVFDGGTGYWGAEYDTQTGKWLHFAFNGR